MRPVCLSTKYKAVLKALKTDRFQFPHDPNSNLENPPRDAWSAKLMKSAFM